MSIAETRDKCKASLGKIPRDILILGVLVLASTLCFGFGYLAGLDATQASPEWPQVTSFTATRSAGAVVASKSGMKYYLPTCAGADRISGDNKVWFPSKEAAEAVGYTPASNCDGL
jgi:hypothetical protein